MKRYVRTGALLLGIFLFFLSGHPLLVMAADRSFTQQFLAGNEDASDEDACVFVILGDGFTKDEQTTFAEKAKEMAEEMLTAEPFSEETECIKMYALGTISEESGVRGDQASALEEVASDKRNTLFQCSYWCNKEERLLAMSDENEKKALLIAREYVPEVDFCIVLANAVKYGGSGGRVAVTSLNEKGGEILLHELGHTMAGLGDEYWPGSEAMKETPNTTKESDEAKVPWASFVGKDGIGVYSYAEGDGEWYKPSDQCKMEFLGKDHPFCAVCREAIREAVRSHADLDQIESKARVKKYIPAAGAILFAGVLCLVVILRKKKN